LLFHTIDSGLISERTILCSVCYDALCSQWRLIRCIWRSVEVCWTCAPWFDTWWVTLISRFYGLLLRWMSFCGVSMVQMVFQGANANKVCRCKHCVNTSLWHRSVPLTWASVLVQSCHWDPILGHKLFCLCNCVFYISL